jgi:type IV pilus assembly protein PilW
MRQLQANSEKQNGFSLIELLVAMAIGLVLLGALFAIFLGTSQGARQSDTVTRMGEDASIALETMARHIRMAAYSQPNLLASLVTVVVNGQTVQQKDSNFSDAGVRACDGGFTRTTDPWDALDCAKRANASDAISIRYEGDNFNTEAIAGARGRVATDCLSQGVETNAISAADTSKQYTLVESRFFINANSELACAGNAATNTGTVPFISQPLISGVEKMQLRYGVTGDSVATQVGFWGNAADVDALGGTADQNWARVIAVRICLQMVSPKRDQISPVSYVDCDGKTQTPTDKFLRRSFTTTVSVRNRIGVLP